MAIMDIFRNTFGGNTAPPGAASNPTIPNGAADNKSDGSIPGIPPAPSKDQSPLAGFASLWETKDDNKGNEAPSLVPKFNLDPTKFGESVSKMDFLSTLPAELQTKIAGGDFTAMLQAVNHVGQQAFARGVEVNTRMMETAFSNQANTLMTHTLPNTIKDHSTKTAVLDMSPILNNPAVAPIVNIVRQQFTQHNPMATPAETAAAVNSYFQTFGQELLKGNGFDVQQSQKVAPGTPRQTDWGSFLDSKVG